MDDTRTSRPSPLPPDHAAGAPGAPPAPVSDEETVRLLGSTWGRRVAAHRRRQGLTQHELSTACGVRQQTVSKIERGELVPLDRLKWRLALALGCSPAGLWAWPPLGPAEAGEERPTA